MQNWCSDGVVTKTRKELKIQVIKKYLKHLFDSKIMQERRVSCTYDKKIFSKQSVLF